jgi:hypothetical protein
MSSISIADILTLSVSERILLVEVAGARKQAARLTRGTNRKYCLPEK